MIRFRDLKKADIKKISDGCGVMAKGLNVPNFIFEARCDQHDFYTVRGTGWAWNETYLRSRFKPDGILLLPYSIVRWYIQGQFYLQKANILFYYYMIKDSFNPQNQILEKVIYAFLSTVYFICVSLWALIPRTKSMCRWRTLDEMIEYTKRERLYRYKK